MAEGQAIVESFQLNSLYENHISAVIKRGRSPRDIPLKTEGNKIYVFLDEVTFPSDPKPSDTAHFIRVGRGQGAIHTVQLDIMVLALAGIEFLMTMCRLCDVYPTLLLTMSLHLS